MVVLGLTGSIGMGKTTVANALKTCGATVYNADAAVHRLLAPGGAAVGPVLARFPDAASGEGAVRAVDRGALGAQVFADAGLWRSWRRSSTPWSGPASGVSSRPVNVGAAASQSWTCPSSSRPAARPAAMRRWWSQPLPSCSARGCWGGRA